MESNEKQQPGLIDLDLKEEIDDEELQDTGIRSTTGGSF